MKEVEVSPPLNQNSMKWAGIIHRCNNCYAVASLNVFASCPLLSDVLTNFSLVPFKKSNLKTANLYFSILKEIKQHQTKTEPLDLNKIIKLKTQSDTIEFISNFLSFMPENLQQLYTFTRNTENHKNPIQNQIFLDNSLNFDSYFQNLISNGDLLEPIPPNLFLGRVFSDVNYDQAKLFQPKLTFTLQDIEFHLHGIVFHRGKDFNSGHYVSYILSGDTDPLFIFYNGLPFDKFHFEEVISNEKDSVVALMLYTTNQSIDLPTIEEIQLNTDEVDDQSLTDTTENEHQSISKTSSDSFITDSSSTSPFVSDNDDSLSENLLFNDSSYQSSESDIDNEVQLPLANDLCDPCSDNDPTSSSTHAQTNNNENLSLTEYFREGEIYARPQLMKKIDNYARQTNRVLHTIKNHPYFRQKCPVCSAVINGKCLEDETILITSIRDHTCNPKKYRPNKETRSEIKALMKTKEKIKDSITDIRVSYDHPIPLANRTLYMYMQELRNKTEDDDLNYWKFIQSLTQLFSNEEDSNILYTENTINGENIVESFFVVPPEAIAFLNSKLFCGLLVFDGTFLPQNERGQFVIFATFTPNHECIPLGFGVVPTENSKYLIPIFEIMKKIITTGTGIQIIISDEGSGIKKAMKKVFPNVIHRLCILHKSSNYCPILRSMLFKLMRAPTKTEFYDLLNSFLNNKGLIEKINKSQLDDFKNNIELFSPLFTPGPTQNTHTNGLCESLNALIKSYSFKHPFEFTKYLYFRLRDTLTNIPCNPISHYTPYVDKFINGYEEAKKFIKVEIITTSSLTDSYCVSDTSHAHGKTRNCGLFTLKTLKCSHINFYVYKENGKYNCSCGRSTELGFPCIHIYFVCKMNNDMKTFYENISDYYRESFILPFTEQIISMKRIDFDGLVINMNITACFKRKPKGEKRKKSKIDFIKGKKE